MSIENKLGKYLNEEEGDLGNYDPIKDASSLSNGLRRLTIYLQKANTPRKFQIAFALANELVQKFPLKSKIVWKVVADAYSGRFTPVGGA